MVKLGQVKQLYVKQHRGKTLVISAEAGLLSIKDSKNVDALEVKEAAEVMEIHRLLESGEIKYDTVCLDSISEISEILLNFEKSRNKDPEELHTVMYKKA